MIGFRGWSFLEMVSLDSRECLSAWTITESDSGMGNNSGIIWISPSRLEGLAKWCQGEKGNLEVLQSEWDSDNGYATDKSADKVRNCDFPPAEKNPKYIHEYAETAPGILAVHDLCPERP